MKFNRSKTRTILIIIVVVVVVVVVVVSGQTGRSISSKSLANDCLSTLEVCTTSMIATSSHGHLGDFLRVFIQLFLKEFNVLLLTTSLGSAFQVEVI